jgi:hypothetical protein
MLTKAIHNEVGGHGEWDAGETEAESDADVEKENHKLTCKKRNYNG